jgi:hypothetical protein
MRFYNVEVKGKMMLEKRTSHPSYTTDDIGRLYMCDGYMYIISDLNAGPSLLCSHIIYDGFSTDMRYGQLMCSNNWDGAQTFNFSSNQRMYLYDPQPCAVLSTLVICRGSVGYPAAGCGLEIRNSYGSAAFMCSEFCYGVSGYSNSSYAVVGNTAYYNYSSKYIKHFENVCLSSCIKERPLSVYKYYWEDTNNHGFNQSIGPLAEDFNATFNIDNKSDKEDYEGVWTVDGVAFGLALENLKEIDKLKDIVVELYSCIQKLENKEI